MRYVSTAFMLSGLLLAGPFTRAARAAWALGPLGGATFTFDDIDNRDVSAVTSWNFGARLQTGVTPLLGVMFDPMLVRSSVDFDAPDLTGSGDIVTLELPILLNAGLRLGTLGVYGFIGPDLIFPTDASGNADALNDLRTGDLNTVVWAGQIGAGLALGVSPFIDLTVDARYTHGFSDLLEKAKGDIAHWRTRDVRLIFGVLLHTPRMGALLRPGTTFDGNP